MEGWEGFVLKEKLKWVMFELRGWHKEHCYNLSDKIHGLKEDLNSLDVKGEKRH